MGGHRHRTASIRRPSPQSENLVRRRFPKEHCFLEFQGSSFAGPRPENAVALGTFATHPRVRTRWW